MILDEMMVPIIGVKHNKYHIVFIVFYFEKKARYPN